MLFGLLGRGLGRGRVRPARAGGAARGAWTLERLEDRAVPATVAYATGAGAGGGAQVNVYDETGALITALNAFPGFTGGVQVATGDINGDGVKDVIAGAGAGGGPQVNVYDGAALLQGRTTELMAFFAYAGTFRGGVNVASGDVNGDGRDDILTGAGPGGGPHVKVFDGKTVSSTNVDGSLMYTFMAYNIAFMGGVSVAAADVGGDNGGTPGGHGTAEIVTGAGAGGGPHVKVFARGLTDPKTLDTIASFMAYDPSFRGGVYVAAGFVTNNLDSENFHYADIVTSPGAGGGPHIKVFRLDNGANATDFQFIAVGSYSAFDPGFRGGARVAVTDLNGDGQADIIASAGPGGGPAVDARAGQALGDGQTFQPALLFDNFAYPAAFGGGVFVG